MAINGNIMLSNLPPHFGMVVSLAFFEVDSENSDPPYDSEPPAEAISDSADIYNNVDLDKEINEKTKNILFKLEHARGYFYLQVRVILFRKNENKTFAQAEQFFFDKGPIAVTDKLSRITLPVEWPNNSIEELDRYGTIKPNNR